MGIFALLCCGGHLPHSGDLQTRLLRPGGLLLCPGALQFCPGSLLRPGALQLHPGFLLRRLFPGPLLRRLCPGFLLCLGTLFCLSPLFLLFHMDLALHPSHCSASLLDSCRFTFRSIWKLLLKGGLCYDHQLECPLTPLVGTPSRTLAFVCWTPFPMCPLSLMLSCHVLPVYVCYVLIGSLVKCVML